MGAELRLISDDEPDEVVNVNDDEVLAIKAELADKERSQDGSRRTHQ